MSFSVWEAPKDYPRPIRCPICGNIWAPNGMGPTNRPWVVRGLSWLPSTQYLNPAADFHDLAYLIAPERPVAWWWNGRRFEIHTREDADRAFLEQMLDLADVQPVKHKNRVARFFANKKAAADRKFLRWAAHRNFEFVRKFGADSFCHKH